MYHPPLLSRSFAMPHHTRRIFWKILVVLLTLRTFPLGATTPGESLIDYDFCRISAEMPGSAAPSPGASDGVLTQPQLWNAAQVQEQVFRLTQSPWLRDTPLNAYPISYVAMTHARDEARCGGILATTDREDALIGDLLADIMSRQLVNAMAHCSETSPLAYDSQVGFCAAMDRIRAQKQNTLSSALEITGVYLSSHMALSLATVVRDDTFWHQEFPEDTHCPAYQNCPQTVINRRIVWMKRYKNHYDRNNQFLAENLQTVITSLTQACYMKQIPVFSASARLLRGNPLLTQVFGSIRDRTFHGGLTLGQYAPPEQNPLLTRTEGGLWMRQFERFATYRTFPLPLAKVEGHARTTLGAPLVLTQLLAPAGGSLGWDQLAADPPSLRPECGR